MFPTEKRQFPRFKKNVLVKVPEHSSGETIDMSETGLRFYSNETNFASPNYFSCSFPEEEITLSANARIIWKKDASGGKSEYGVEFVNLSPGQKIFLRKEFISTQIKDLCCQLKSTPVIEDVFRFFLEDMLTYINELVKINSYACEHDEYNWAIERKLASITNQVVLKGYCLEQLCDDHSITCFDKENFRALAGTWFYKSPLMKRAFDKPKGQGRDYLLLEAIYENHPLADNGIGVYFDRYFLQTPYASSLRLRKDKIRDLIKQQVLQSSAKMLRIMVIGCGPFREMREIPRHYFNGRGVIFTCLDCDEEALAFSRNKLLGCCPENIKFVFAQEHLSPEGEFVFSRDWEKQDFIYSLCLLDYLPDSAASSFAKKVFRLLKVGGKLVLMHKNKEKNFSPLAPDWCCDCSTVARDKEEVLRIFYRSGMGNFSVSAEPDFFNDTVYFTLMKLSD